MRSGCNLARVLWIVRLSSAQKAGRFTGPLLIAPSSLLVFGVFLQFEVHRFAFEMKMQL